MLIQLAELIFHISEPIVQLIKKTNAEICVIVNQIIHSTMTTQNNSIKKPAPLRVIFILNALMMILPFVFYAVITSKNIKIGNLDPILMVYTGLAYIASFAVLVFFLIKRNLVGARIVFLANIAIAIPTGAYIGILIAIISLALSFFNQKVLGYFYA